MVVAAFMLGCESSRPETRPRAPEASETPCFDSGLESIEDRETAICVAGKRGIPASQTPFVAQYIEHRMMWVVDSTQTTPCETPGHYTGVSMWLDADSGEAVGRLYAFSKTTTTECEE